MNEIFASPEKRTELAKTIQQARTTTRTHPMLITSWLHSVKSILHRQPRKLSASAPSRRRAALRAQATTAVSSEVEQLEQRTLLSVAAAFNPFSGELRVLSDADDSISISAAGGNVVVTAVESGVTRNVPIGTVAAANVQVISVTGGPGANIVDLSAVTAASFTNPLLSISVNGDHGADIITASPLGGYYNGHHGDDTLIGGGGNDTLDGDDGHDVVSGGAGDDSLIGEDGNDLITGGTGNDSIDAGDGADTADGGAGNDLIIGSDGADSLDGSGGDDSLNGGAAAMTRSWAAATTTCSTAAPAMTYSTGKGARTPSTAMRTTTLCWAEKATTWWMAGRAMTLSTGKAAMTVSPAATTTTPFWAAPATM
jgi:hypothetical protein